MARRLFLIRHAHRNTSKGRERDNGLSKRGETQTQALKKYLRKELKNETPIFMTSPALRCVETLEPITQKMKRKLQVVEFLHEQREGESVKQFERRVGFFVKSWHRSSAAATIVCSHSDWVTAALHAFLGIELAIDKGGLCELAEDGKQVVLRTLIQDFDNLL